MHKIWQGMDPIVVLGSLFSFLFMLAMAIHVFAFSVVGYPKTTKAKYNPPAAATALR